MNDPYKATDLELERLEKRLKMLYSGAYRDLQDKVDEYFDRLKDRAEDYKEKLEAGEITRDDYSLWMINQLARGERFYDLRDEFAQAMTKTNEIAAAYINDTTPGIYSLNHNYTAYEIERVGGNIGFTLYDTSTVRRLLVDNPELFPKLKVDIPLDLKWNQQKITDEITSGILQGEPIGKIADRFQNVTGANRVSALRNARSLITSAQNAGRQDSYDRATEMGIKVKKRWIAVKDSRTRYSHRHMDGKTIDVDDVFVTPMGSKMRYPGDRNGKAGDFYNCRCTMRTVEPSGFEAEARKMRVRDPDTGKYIVVSEMTYEQWERWVKSRENRN